MDSTKDVSLDRALSPDRNNPLLPWQFVASSGFNIQKAIRLVNYQYVITATDVSNTYINISVPHGLSSKPFVQASFSNSNDSLYRQLPYFWQNSTQSYYTTSAPGADSHVASYSVQIYSIDNTNINVSIKIFDILGVSQLAANNTLNFKFYCQQFTLD